MERQTIGRTILHKDTLLHNIMIDESKTGRPMLRTEFKSGDDIITSLIPFDNIKGLTEACIFLKSLDITDTQENHLYKNEKQFETLINGIFRKIYEPLGGGRITREGTPYGDIRFTVEETTTASGWRTLNILHVKK